MDNEAISLNDLPSSATSQHTVHHFNTMHEFCLSRNSVGVKGVSTKVNGYSNDIIVGVCPFQPSSSVIPGSLDV